jgi:nucleotide-binding universal stress UspA family protein
MHQQTRSARQAELSARPRHGHDRDRRKPTRPPPMTIVGYDATPQALLEGRRAEVLGRLAQLRDAQEIVVGSRAPGRRRRKPRRSVSRSLVATASRPVVIVPAPTPA